MRGIPGQAAIRRLAIVGPVLIALALAGCGSSSSPSSSSSTPASTPAAPTSSTTSTPSTPSTTSSTSSTSPSAAGIPQNNEGDHDTDNNGAPSDGDGNL